MSFEINSTIFLRSPSLPFSLYHRSHFESYIYSADFLEALYVASPVLYHQFVKMAVNDTRVMQPTLAKYLLRAFFRPTPFGFFAACTVVEFGEETDILFKDKVRHTRLDFSCVIQLAELVERMPEVRPLLKYFPNNSHYPVGNHVRYIEFTSLNDTRNYNLTSIVLSEEIKQVLRKATQGCTIGELAQDLVSEEITLDEATVFIESLIGHQLLVSELQPAITGESGLVQLLHTLIRLEKHPLLQEVILALTKITEMMQQMDKQATNPISSYQVIREIVLKWGLDHPEHKIFQVDLIKTTQQNSLSKEIKANLTVSVEALLQLNSVTENADLSSFKKRFEERYQDRFVPLLQVLDTESGIGYPHRLGIDPGGLLQGLNLPPSQSGVVSERKTNDWLKRKLNEALFFNQYTLDIQPKDLKDLPPFTGILPPSFSLIFRVTDFEKNQVLIESVGGCSGVNLAARFAQADEQIKDTLQHIVSREESDNPSVLLAEIVHLPNTRIGNVLKHPSLRDYEIPFLAQSSVNAGHQIPLQDLYVGIENDEVQLISHSLSKRIIPRLSNAHNFHLSELPVYRFLCDLQSQSLQDHLTFAWDHDISTWPFLPRVTYGQAIFSLATWNLPRAEFDFLFDQADLSFTAKVEAFRKKWRLPQYVVFAEDDMELYVDFEDILTIQSFKDSIRLKVHITLMEYLFDKNSVIRDINNGRYINQFIAPVFNTRVAYQPIIPRERPIDKPKVDRAFFPGSRWLSYKLYCSPKVADEILLGAIYPLSEKLLTGGLIKKWFFIRYEDDSHHLRVRFFLSRLSSREEVMTMVLKSISPFENKDMLWKVVVDTYFRELERYGEQTMDLSESVFFLDSSTTAKFLTSLTPADPAEIRWLWGIRAIDDLLNDFGLDLADKLSLLEGLKEAYAREFQLNKRSKIEIDKKFRMCRKDIESILTKYPKRSYLEGREYILKERTKKTTALARKIKGRLEKSPRLTQDELLGSYIHMSLNRLLLDQQRASELVIYHLLFDYYKGKSARKKRPGANAPK